MLTIYRSNRAEWLANVVSEELRISPPSISESVEIVVSTWPTSRWLGDKIALVTGINSQVKFPFPGSYLREIVRKILQKETRGNSSWQYNQLVWPILKLLPEIIDTNESRPLKDWIEDRGCSNIKEINKDIWQLADSIAKVFDEYILYRPDLIKQWSKSNSEDFKKLVKRLPLHLQWQPSLFRLLYKEINEEPFSLDVEEAIKYLSDKESDLSGLPKEIRIFGISSLAPIQIELIQALSGEIDIKMYLLTPCQDLWKRYKKRREVLGKEWGEIPDETWLINSTRLEANLGRMGSEFQQLLEGSGEYQLGETIEEDLFALPAAIAKNKSKEPTLLEQLQESLIKNEKKRPLYRKKNDDSLLFVECPGAKREIELIRDQLLQWLAKDDSLQPRDILIMTPQVERFSPLIASVFNDLSSTKVNLPWRITDRSQNDKPGLSTYILQLLDLAAKRFTATGLHELMSNQSFQNQYSLSPEDITNITTYLQQTGFTWGIDSKERNGDDVHSLLWALDRWLIGLVLPSNQGITVGGKAPISSSFTPKDLIKWWEILSALCKRINEMRRAKTCEEWVDYLKFVLKDSLNTQNVWLKDYHSFLTAIEEWRQSAIDCNLKIDCKVVKEILHESIAKDTGRFGHRSGSITISELEPMRAIPHRVIVLMGLNESLFPRSFERNSFNLIGHKRKLGDPCSNSQDRYALLEALMSTRQHLMLTWNCRDEKTGENLEAASPIQQWLDYLSSELGEVNIKSLIRKPPANPLNIRNFMTNNSYPAISCSTKNLEACLLINKQIKPRPLGIAIPLKWSKQEIESDRDISTELLRDWLTAPQQAWLTEQKIKAKEWNDSLDNEDKYELGEIERYQLVKTRLEGVTDLIQVNTIKEVGCKFNYWEKETEGKGIIPYKSAGKLEIELLEKRWKTLLKQITSIGPFKKKSLKIEEDYKEFKWAGEFHISIEVGKLKNKGIMQAWIKHLLICANGIPNKGTIIISRTSKDNYEQSLRWQVIDCKDAKKILNDLKKLASHGLIECWPVPPESGWIFAKAQKQKVDKAAESFQKSWDGDYYSEGESQKDEMKLCFGTNCEASYFLDSLDFHKAITLLYEPILNNLL